MGTDADQNWLLWPSSGDATTLLDVTVKTSVDEIFSVLFGGDVEFTSAFNTAVSYKEYAATPWVVSRQALPPPTPNPPPLPNPPAATPGQVRLATYSGTSLGTKFLTEERQQLVQADRGKLYTVCICVATTASYGDRFRPVLEYSLSARGPQRAAVRVRAALVFVKSVNGIVRGFIDRGARDGMSRSFQVVRDILAKRPGVEAAGGGGADAAAPPGAAQEPSGVSGSAAPQSEAEREAAVEALPQLVQALAGRPLLRALQPWSRALVGQLPAAPPLAERVALSLLACLFVAGVLRGVLDCLLMLEAASRASPGSLLSGSLRLFFRTFGRPENLLAVAHACLLAWAARAALDSGSHWIPAPPPGLAGCWFRRAPRAGTSAAPRAAEPQGVEPQGVTYEGYAEALAAVHESTFKPEAEEDVPVSPAAREASTASLTTLFNIGWSRRFLGESAKEDPGAARPAPPAAPPARPPRGLPAPQPLPDSFFERGRASAAPPDGGGGAAPAEPATGRALREAASPSPPPSRALSPPSRAPSPPSRAASPALERAESGAGSGELSDATGVRSPPLPSAQSSASAWGASSIHRLSHWAGISSASSSSAAGAPAAKVPRVVGAAVTLEEALMNPQRTARALTSASASELGAGLAGRAVIEHLFENQRLQPFRGWGHSWPGHFLPTDRVAHWTRMRLPGGDAGAQEVSSQRFVEVAPRLEEGWQWLEETWHVDLSGSIVDAVDDEGWSYGLDFGRVAHPFSPGAGLKSVADFVRRRRWIRTRVPLPEGGGRREADVDVAVAAPLHAMMDVEEDAEEENGKEKGKENGEENGKEKGVEKSKEEGGKTAEKNGEETAEKNGEETAEKNGEETVEKNGEETVEENGEKTVERNGKETVEKNGATTVEDPASESSNSAGASEATLRRPVDGPGEERANDGLEDGAPGMVQALDAAPGLEGSTAPMQQSSAVPGDATSSTPSLHQVGAPAEGGLCARAAPADERGDVAQSREAACKAEPGASDGSFTVQGTAIDASSAVDKDASFPLYKRVLGATPAFHVPALAFVDGAPSAAGLPVAESVSVSMPPREENAAHLGVPGSAPASQSPSEIAVGETSTSQSEELSMAQAEGVRVTPVKPDGLLAVEPLSVSILPTGVEFAPAPPAAEPAAVLDSGHLFGGAKGVSRGR